MVVLAVAPDLVEADHAWLALETARERLLGPLGLATLHKHDWAYRCVRCKKKLREVEDGICSFFEEGG